MFVMIDFKKNSFQSPNYPNQGSLGNFQDTASILEKDYADNLSVPVNYKSSFSQKSNSNQNSTSREVYNSYPQPQPNTNNDELRIYKEKYLQLLDRQLTIIREQKKQSQSQEVVSSLAGVSNINKKYKKKSSFQLGSILGFWATAVLVPVILFWGIFNESIVYGLEGSASNYKQVAGISEVKGAGYINQADYEKWIRNFTGLILLPGDDQDGDGLTNGEEFLLDTNPIEAFSCDGEKNDLENLLALIDPISCEKLDLEDELDLNKYEQVLHIPTIANKMFIFQDVEEKPVSIGSSVLEIFGVENYSQINLTGQGQIQREIELNKKREEYSQTILKIDQYISANRSYEEYDREYATPVHPAIFLETSIKYDVPLKYVLTVARLESRFGTDRYTRSGNLTRPGANQNMYSIGLDDSGNNKAYSSWEDGVYGFGRWYKYFDDRGVGDCQKWKIYNPNGDYCSKVEKYASEVEAYIYG